MSKLLALSEFSKLKDQDDLQRMLSAFCREVHDVVNGNLEFDANIKTKVVDATFSSSATDVAINHSFNRTDVKYIVCGKDATCDVFDGATVNSKTTIYLQSTAAAKVRLILF